MGVLDYSFGNFKLYVTEPLTRVDGGLAARGDASRRTDHEIVVGTYNVENLDPGDGPAVRAPRRADREQPPLARPDRDRGGPGQRRRDRQRHDERVGQLDACSWRRSRPPADRCTSSGRSIRVDNEDGGQPGGNIRVGFLFRTDRGLSFIDRPGGDATTPTTVIDHPSGPRLSLSPGRVDPEDPAWEATRKPLAGEFRMRGKKVFVIANHFSSKGGDEPLFGRFQPPTRSTEVARHAQAQSVNDFVDELLAVDPDASVIVLGDINDFEFSETVDILEGGVLTSLMDTLPKPERYSYVFEGNSQVLDQILVSGNLLGNFPIDYDPVHVNSEFADQASDHDPQVARLDLRGRPTPK